MLEPPVGSVGRSKGDAVLVVGGTGVLRPAVACLRAAGRPVIVLSRAQQRLDGLPPGTSGLLGDLGDPPALARLLASVAGHPRAAACLAYLPAAAEPAGMPALAVLRAAVAGPLVVLLTSAAAGATPAASPDPRDLLGRLVRRLGDAGSPAGDLRLLLLGWAAPLGNPARRETRWHTPTEISAAALACLDDPAPRLLGEVRPWGDRPR